MPRVDTLSLLGTLIDSLQPLGAMSAGQPIKAADWNALVEAVRTVARVAVARERTMDELLDERYARGDHQHVGQVGLAWFDPATRALLEENINGSAVQRASVEQARADMARLRTDLDGLKLQLTDLRIAFDGLRDSDSARERTVERVASRVEALRDVETRVTGLDTRLGSIANDVGKALSFRDELSDESGAPIDLGAFGRRITELESMRRNLTTAGGELVQIREIERALARLESNTLTRAVIDDAVRGRLQDRAALERSGLVAAVREAIDEGLDPRLAGIDQLGTRHAELLDGLRGALDDQTQRLGQQDTRMAAVEGQVTTLSVLPDRLAAQQARLSDAESRLQSVQNGVADLPALRSQLAQARSDVSGLAGLPGTVAQHGTQLQANGAALSQLATASAAGSERLTAVERALPGLQQAATVATQQAATITKLDTRLTAGEAQLDNLARLPGTTDALSGQVRGLLDFQAASTQSLTDLSRRMSGVTTINDRLLANERLAAETRNSLARVSDQVTSMTVRIERIEITRTNPGTTGGGVVRPG